MPTMPPPMMTTSAGSTPGTPPRRTPRPPLGFRHRREQRQRGVAGDRLVRDAGDVLLHQRGGEIGNRREVEIREEELAVLEAIEIGLDRLFDLHDHVSRVIDLVRRRKDLAAREDVFVVGETAAVACALLDEDFMSVGGEVLHAGRDHAHAVFVVFDLGRYADTHFESPSPVSRRAF
jgi:hypothetical protein